MSDCKQDKEPCAARRRILGAAALATIMLAPGVSLIAAARNRAEGVGSKVSTVRWGLLIDTTKCTTSCNDCVSACSDYNGWKNTGLATDPQWIRKVSLNNPVNGATHSLPVMCQHCADAPCVEVCPTGASFKRADGIVLVDRHICIGCRYCMMACPYKARSLVFENVTDQNPQVPRGRGTVEACTLCAPRIDAGELPACVEACANGGHGAMTFGDLNDPNSEIRRKIAAYPAAQLRADLELDPSVQYQGL